MKLDLINQNNKENKMGTIHWWQSKIIWTQILDAIAKMAAILYMTIKTWTDVPILNTIATWLNATNIEWLVGVILVVANILTIVFKFKSNRKIVGASVLTRKAI